MKWIARDRSEQNEAMIDPWTIVHFSAGLACGLMRTPPAWVATAAILYELGEQWLEREDLGKKLFHTHGPERIENAAMDLVAMAGGYRLGRCWSDSGRS